MVDPWNIAGVVLAASKVAWHIGLFWREAGTAPLEARELQQTVALLKTSVENVREGFISRQMLDDVEQKNYRSIVNLVDKCEKDLKRLQLILPKPPEEGGTIANLRTQLARKLAEDNVRDIVMGIKLCNSMEQTPKPDHTSIQVAWDRVLDEADSLLSHRPFRQGDPDWDDKLDDFVNSLRESASTSDGRTTVPDLPQPRRNSRQSSISATINYRDDDDSGVAIIDDLDDVQEDSTAVPTVLGNSVLPRTLRKVAKFMREGNYREAAIYQQRAIGYRRKFAGEKPLDTAEVCRDEMKLAEIYRKMGTTAGLNRAEVTLLGVIDRIKTDELDSKVEKDSLLAELYHDLGHTCIELKKLDVGCNYLTEAFNLMAESPTQPIRLLRSVGIMLFRIYTNLKKPELAEVLDEYAENTCGFSLRTLAWCQENGFDTESKDFSFDRCEPGRGISPLHLVVEQGDLEILAHMLQHPLDLEVRESKNGRTPLLVACSQQDIEALKLLLNHGARPDVTDKLSKNGLHLCQRANYGTQVARCLLQPPSAIDIDAMDGCQNTALHLAASMGNQPMVRVLLDLGAKADIQGPGGWTPLMAAVQATMRSQDEKLNILKALVDKGADPTLKYSGGQTAIDMANDSQIRKNLKNWSKQFSKPPRKFSLAWRS
ncbi:hypothetical protein jhhlp_003944 [Lomentospora prolificans]|uniref:Uncharacterized protein n=1 Tax=Lomentospora prolificans TaxID=41688 RepID=A0A2N3NA64_9PEZI|nr:hypothetical protein jhhlp_003944 [Lomentospora prolificans]